MRFADWLLSLDGQERIGSLTRKGEQLFHPQRWHSLTAPLPNLPIFRRHALFHGRITGIDIPAAGQRGTALPLLATLCDYSFN